MPNPPLIKKSRIGRGLFADARYRAGQVITKITGTRVSADDVWEIGGTFADNCFRFGPETFLDPGDGYGRYLNHSCEPNAAITKTNHQLFLVAAAAIARGEELAIDYSTILGADDIWTMRCGCRRRTCRRRVRNIATLPAELRRVYVERGMVPGFILDTL